MFQQKVFTRVPLTAELANLEGVMILNTPFMSEKVKTHAIIDFETTGLDTKFDEIIEMGIFIFQEHPSGMLQPIMAANWLNEPSKPISAEITAITGITQEDVAGKRIDWNQVRMVLDEVDLFGAHNAAFDRKFFNRYFGQDNRPWYCTSKGGDVDWKKLGFNTAGLELLMFKHDRFYDAHRAVVDCAAVFHLIELQPNILPMVYEAMKVDSAKISAFGAPIRVKDDLKARGYRWNPEAKVWWIFVSGAAAIDSELTFLEELYFNGRNSAVVEIIPAYLKHLGE